MSPPSASTYSCSVKRSCALTSLSRIGRFRLSTPPPIDPSSGTRASSSAGLYSPAAALTTSSSPSQQRDDQRPRVHERAPALDDQLEDALELHLASDRFGDVRRRAHPRMACSSSSARIARGRRAGVLDRDAGPCREEDRRLLVRLRERAVVLLGEVQVPPGLAANQDRHTEERRHRRMLLAGTRRSSRGSPTSARRSGSGCSIRTPRTPRPRGGRRSRRGSRHRSRAR